MRAVGIRELKNRLSEVLRLVSAGEEILVTDRGEVVAELRRPGSTRDIQSHPFPLLLSYAREGKVRLGSPNRPDLYPPPKTLLPQGVVNSLLDQERGDR